MRQLLPHQFHPQHIILGGHHAQHIVKTAKHMQGAQESMQGSAGMAVFHTPDCTERSANTLRQVFLAQATHTARGGDVLSKALQRTLHRPRHRDPRAAISLFGSRHAHTCSDMDENRH
ncbi:Uncharacterised protein [Bordetella pertussis]|nr:Uncharacterised protein [Bordetella pertussis]